MGEQDMLTPNLTDAEVDAICDGLKQSAAKVRYLRRLGLTVNEKPNGRPLVNRKHYDEVMGGVVAAEGNGLAEPNWSRR